MAKDHPDEIPRSIDTAMRVVLSFIAAMPLAASIYVVSDGRVVDLSTAAYYVLLPLVVSGGLLGLQRLEGRARTNAALGGAALVLAVYAADLSVYAFETHRDRVPPDCAVFVPTKQAQCALAKRRGTPFDTRTMLQALRDLEHAHPSDLVVPFAAPRTLDLVGSGDGVIAPLAGVSGALTVYCNFTGEYQSYRSDEHGFRNPDRWGRYEGAIALVGDSYTQGHCVDGAATIAGRLRDRGYRVINLGINDSGPLAELAILTEYALLNSPEVVVWLYYEGNDLDDLEKETSNSRLVRYLEEPGHQRLIERQSLVDSLLLEALEQERRLAEVRAAQDEQSEASEAGSWSDFLLARHLRRLVSTSWSQVKDDDRPLAPHFPFDSLTFRESLRIAANRTQARGAAFVFVYLPQFDRYSGRYEVAPHKRTVIRIVEGLGIPVLDMDTVFVGRDPFDAFPNGMQGHYSEEGYRWVAAAMDRWLKRSGHADHYQ